jgi:hypothetical protein
MKQFGSYNLQASHQSPFTFCWSAPIRSDMAHYISLALVV